MPGPLRCASLIKHVAGLLLLPCLLGCENPLDNLYPKLLPVQLPAETQTGANAFGCLLNGRVWEASNAATLTGKVLTPHAQYHRGQLRLNAFRRLQVVGPVTNIHLTAENVTAPGVYRLGTDLPEHNNYGRLETSSGLIAYFTDAEHPGALTITRLDTAGVHPVVSGRFELRAIPRAGTRLPADYPAELQITEGRFDIQLNR